MKLNISKEKVLEYCKKNRAHIVPRKNFCKYVRDKLSIREWSDIMEVGEAILVSDYDLSNWANTLNLAIHRYKLPPSDGGYWVAELEPIKGDMMIHGKRAPGSFGSRQ